MVLEEELAEFFFIDLDHTIFFIAFAVHHLFYVVFDFSFIIVVAFLLLVSIWLMDVVIISFLFDLLLHTFNAIVFAFFVVLFLFFIVVGIFVGIFFSLVNTYLLHLHELLLLESLDHSRLFFVSQLVEVVEVFVTDLSCVRKVGHHLKMVGSLLLKLLCELCNLFIIHALAIFLHLAFLFFLFAFYFAILVFNFFLDFLLVFAITHFVSFFCIHTFWDGSLLHKGLTSILSREVSCGQVETIVVVS